MINMNNIKKRAIFFLVLFLLFGLAERPLAKQRVEVLFFFSQTCAHCAKENAFLERLEKRYPNLEIQRKEISQRESIKLLEQYYTQYQVKESERARIPVTFIKDKYFLGYSGDLTSGQEIEKYIQAIMGTDAGYLSFKPKREINLPLIGRLDLSQFSPLFLAVFLGLLDGFNACAMVALGFLLAVLIGTGIRKFW
jgi:glutaredoxin-related protein